LHYYFDYVDLDFVDENGNTYLHIASTKGFSKILSILLSIGCSCEIRNKKELTAREESHENVVNIWKLWEEGGTSALPAIFDKLNVKELEPLLLVQDFSEILGSKPTETKNAVTVAQFNVLADYLAVDDFPLTDRDVLKWDYRKENLIRCMIAHSPDVIALEECDHFEDWFLPELSKEGFDGIFYVKKGGRDGTALFWKTDKFKKVNESNINYEGGSQGLLLVHLGHTTCDGGLCVAATHLKAKPEFHETRKRQGEILIPQTLDFNKEKNWPVIVLGDFNDTPESSVIELTKKNFKSAYDHNTPGHWTTWKIRGTEVKRTIDYIWYQSEKLHLTHYLQPPLDKDCPKALPASYWPSDHLMLVAKFLY